jgi:hypothetical protein
MVVRWAFTLLALLLATPPAEAAPARPLRDQVAARWAPTIFQESRDPVRDFISAFDFDGDWDASNNAANVDKFPLRAVVYYTVQETATHWFVQYLPYHPVDYKWVTGHAHDTESVLLAVSKRGGPFGTPEVMETRFHVMWHQYARAGAAVRDGADDIDGPIHFDETGRPTVYAQRASHGLCGGFSPPFAVPDLQIHCIHAMPPKLSSRGVVYRYTGQAGTPDPTLATQEVGYELVEISSTWWAHAQDPAVFVRWRDFRGERCGTPGWRCPRHVGRGLGGIGESVASPWGQSPGEGADAVGDTFFDPAFTLAKRLEWEPPYSLDYTFNPYIGIVARGLPQVSGRTHDTHTKTKRN